METLDLRKFRKANGIKQQELADFLGIGQGYVSQMERGDRPISKSVMEKIESNPEWKIVLDTLENNGTINFQTEASDAPAQNRKPNPDKRIPLIPYEAVAGPGSFVFPDEFAVDYYKVRDFSNADFLVRVKGDSMSPKYTGGDLVACKTVTERLFFQWGRVYVIYTKSQGVMIKRLQPSKDESCVTCVSDNEKYAPFDVPKEDIVSLALVNGSISMD